MILINDYKRNYYDLIDDPWIDLAMGIVACAIKDYKKAVKTGKPVVMYRKFFRSDWFSVLTRDRINGEYIIEKIEEGEVEDE